MGLIVGWSGDRSGIISKDINAKRCPGTGAKPDGGHDPFRPLTDL